MKRLFLLITLTFIALGASAQKDVTKFLGIPVDGYKSEMRKALMAKGYVPKTYNGTEYFEGEFNGRDVHIYIVTNNNKVYRIMVSEKNTVDEGEIKIKFNNLVYQFMNSDRYFYDREKDQIILENEDISYEMLVHNKKYDANFYQMIDETKIDTLAIQQEAIKKLRQKFTEEEIASGNEDVQLEAQKIALTIGVEKLFSKSVWFRICEFEGEYYLTIYYDNEYNAAKGEDL